MALATFGLFALARPALSQTNLTWDPNGAAAGTGGAGTWNTTASVWFNGVTLVPWTNAAFNNAIFDGTAGVVTLGAGINAHNLTFNTTGYTVAASTLTLGGASPTITAGAGTVVTVGSVVAGTAGMAKAGTGTLILSGANSYSGATTISAGILQVGAGGTVGTLGAGAVTNNAALVINRSNAVTFGQAIGGTGTVTKLGAGTTTLTGTNTYSGATTISAGILQVGAGGTTGTLGTGNITNNAALRINRSDAMTMAQTISGTGSVTKLGAGTTTLTGTNTYSGATTISAGILQVGAGGTTGTLGTGAITNNAALVINRSNAVTFGQAIGGTGTVTKLGAGTTTLTGTNTYSGATTISAGTLQVGNGGTVGTLGTGAVTNNAALVINRSDAVTFGQAIGGTGTVTKLGAGTTTLTGANTYSGATTISAGILQVGAGGTVGTLGTGAVTNNAALVINRSDAVTVAQAIGGTGTLTQFGAGTTTLTGTNTYSGATTISAGTVQVGNGGTVGTLGTGAVTNNAALVINRSDAVTLAQAIGGTGTLTQFGAGTTTLTGTNTYSGVTTISAGTLQVGNGGTTGTLGSGSITDNGTLTFNRSDAITVANTVAGTGNVVKLGSGVLTLAGASTYSGTTTVDAGTLRVNGSLGNTATTVASGATLGGSGNIAGGVTVNAGGKLAPGNSPGTLTVGSLNLLAGSILDYELATPGVVGSGVNDLVDVSTNLTLDGTINVTPLVGFGAGTYRLMNYGGALTNNVLDFGLMPFGFAYQLLTSIIGQVNLLVSNPAPDPVQYWDGGSMVGDGVIAGGSGTWTAGPTNWTRADGSSNQGWGGRTAAFTGTPGTVTVVGPITFNGLQFLTSGYTLAAGSGGVLQTVTADTAISLSPSVTATIEVPITGTGGINVQGSGTLVVVGDNTYTGGTTIASGSTLQIGNGGTSGSIAANVTNSGTLVFNRSGTITFGGGISGAGALRQEGSGTLVLSGANTYAGGTAIKAGTVSISGDANLGSGALLIDGATLQTTETFSSGRQTTLAARGGTIETVNGTNFTAAGGLDGAGALTKTGGGTLTLRGLNSYAGGTRIDAGTVSISDDANLGAPSGAITFGGGTLQTTADLVSSRAININGSGTIETANSSTLLLQGGIGGGTLNKSGNGLLVLTAANTYGGTNLRAGALQVGNCGTTGAITGDVRDDGVLVFSRSDTYAFDGVISGAGAMVKNCTGTTIVTGANTYAGGTLVNAGTLQGDTRSLQGEIVDNAALVFDQAFDGTFRGTLFGSGTVTKAGSGTVLLTGTHGVQGPTTIQAGTLALNGMLAGSVHVSRAGTFDATGMIGGSLIADGRVSVRSPAAGPFGLLGVGGDATFRPGSTYGVTIDAAGQNSALTANGRAVIQGMTVSVTPQPGTYGRATQYAVLRGLAGLSGTATAASSSPALEPHLSQNDTTLFLTLLNMELPLQPFAVTDNGWGIGGALDRVKGAASGDLAAVTRELTALDDRGLARSLDAISGEIHASAVQLAAIDGESVTDVVRSEITTRISQGGGESGGQGDGLWGSNGRRGWFRFRAERAAFEASEPTGKQAGLRGVRGGDGSINGFTMGGDWTWDRRWLFGVGGSYATGQLALSALDASTTFTAPRGIAYLGYARSWWALNGGVTIAQTAYRTTRSFQFTALAPSGGALFDGVDRTATSEPAGIASEVWTEVRIDHRLGAWRVQPTVGLRRARYGLNGWTETGADGLSLAAAAHATNSLQADLGVRVSRSLGRFRPYLSGAARRELTSGRTTVDLNLANQVLGFFQVDGLQLPQNSAIGQAGLLFQTGRVGLSLIYEARHARQQTRQTIQLAIGFQ